MHWCVFKFSKDLSTDFVFGLEFIFRNYTRVMPENTTVTGFQVCTKPRFSRFSVWISVDLRAVWPCFHHRYSSFTS